MRVTPAAQRELTKSRWWRTAPGPAGWQGLLNDSLQCSFWAQLDTTEEPGTHKSMLTPRVLTSMLDGRVPFGKANSYAEIFILKEDINFFPK